jgi:hypothetical protein
MPGVIQRPRPKEEVERDEPEVTPVLVRLDDADHDKLLHLCRIGDTNKNDIIRQCIRHVYDAEMAELRGKSGAA